MRVLPTGAISKNLEGLELAPIASIVQSGVVAITDDGKCVQNHELMRRAVEYARMVGVPVRLSETPPYWARPSVPLGHNEPVWPARAA